MIQLVYWLTMCLCTNLLALYWLWKRILIWITKPICQLNGHLFIFKDVVGVTMQPVQVHSPSTEHVWFAPEEVTVILIQPTAAFNVHQDKQQLRKEAWTPRIAKVVIMHQLSFMFHNPPKGKYFHLKCHQMNLDQVCIWMDRFAYILKRYFFLFKRIHIVADLSNVPKTEKQCLFSSCYLAWIGRYNIKG